MEQILPCFHHFRFELVPEFLSLALRLYFHSGIGFDCLFFGLERSAIFEKGLG
jgi:hypothetical protein